MGERAVDEDPNEDEIKQIAAVVGQSIKDGAVGFSSNRRQDTYSPMAEPYRGPSRKETSWKLFQGGRCQ